ncbi:protein tesmin/TSO1-like CXC 4 isoform X1 [Brassica rapa]|uniref:CRC domain-containing protein n=1 Tax=Brassica campestris TaxID=3711 RepID=M4CA99_BRACM|nr:protein tesmin/TSO1-like CXC 4 isoform X1 [Brassica rapa]
MDTPDKNRISAVSYCNFEDSPVFQYINGLSPIEPVKADHAFHSLALASPSSLFSSPQIVCIKRQDVLVQLKCSGPEEEMANVSETEAFKEQVKVAIELASSLRKGEDGCCSQMGSSDEVVVPMDAENEVIKQSGELCRRINELDADSDMVIQTEEMEAETGSGEQEIPNGKDSRICSFTVVPQQFSYHSGNVVQPCSVQVAAGALDTTLSSLSNVAAFDSTAKAEDEEEIELQRSSKQRSVRRRCLTFDLGGSCKRIPLRDSTNDSPLDFTSINEAPTPQSCLHSSKQETDEILPVPRTIGLHLNALVNPYRNKFTAKDGCVLSHAAEEFTTPVSTIRDLVACDNQIMEEASERSMEGEWVEELGSCKRCRCKRSRCLKLYCDCFAAGLYCVEPCSCQNCFNRPIHEDIVIRSRRNVEARNPLAFAPKVVLTSASATYFGEESNKTPASARHMRGCNCKKSGCSKKYCECYLVGVGCSASCRCIGCKNILCQTNEQFHLPCAVESDAVTINEEAKDHCDYI